jgi:uncharacterized protein with GYD domain
MARYLLVAHQTAESQELREQVTALVQDDRAAEFVLLVPATPVGLLPAVGGEGRTAVQLARWRGARARALLEDVGARVTAVRIGSYDPLVAVEQELRADDYSAVVISTLPRGLSRWMRLDLPRKVARRFPAVKVVHVTARPPMAAASPSVASQRDSS